MIKFINKMFSVFIIILMLLLIFIIDGAIESNKINHLIEDFKSRSCFVYENNNIRYYKVKKTYEYENCENILNETDDIYVGTTGDVYITDRDPLGGFFITKWLSKICWIGHGGIVYDNEGKQMIEIVGNKTKEENIVKIWENDWLTKDSPRYLIMRPKNINNEEKNIIRNESEKILGSKYNYLFLFGWGKRFYCTDVISYLYKKIDVNLNKDYLFTTGSDIATSEELYIIYYREKDIQKDKTYYNVYFLAEE